MNDTAVITQIEALQLKGSLFTLTVLQLIHKDQNAVLQQLDHLIEKTPKFFYRMPVVIDVQKINRFPDAINFTWLKQVLLERNIFPIGVRGGTTEINEEAIRAHLAVMPSSKNDISLTTDTAKSETASVNSYQETLIVTKPVRSGQQIYAKNSDLIVIAPVSHGAELIAAGNIHVYGALRGRAVAGVHGNTQAHIFCQMLDAELIAIAGTYLIKENMPIITEGQYKCIDISLVNEHLHVNRIE
ncbi:MAG: septum site-determining protein MinC [Legionellales bacterium]|nr:septum site-determining protein MinC [Legionellales bacterium]